MVNKRLKKLTALLLSIVMVFSMVTEAFPAAFAAEEGEVSAPSAQADGKNLDFGDSGTTRRPGLYVDFLGDNRNYKPDADEIDADAGSSVLSGLVAPGKIDQSSINNGKTADRPNGTDNRWKGYQNGETYTDGGGSIYNSQTVFWVGVGIDRMNMLELFQDKDHDGIYSAELGFYYDSTFIEPYTGATANDDAGYRAVIEAANLANYASYKWDGYSIVDARTDLEPQTDPVTQEVIQRPDMNEIMSENAGNTWRMTYVSIEKTNVVTNRFSGLYDDKAAKEDDLETKYLLIIPFVLKQYDPNWQTRVCLRLARSAGLLSIGSDDGDTPYTAWERVTTRNPGHELKLMTEFQGDLNIFSGGRYLEEPYDATLLIRKAGGDNNRAELTIENDPSPNKVKADTDGDQITGLYGGTGMRLDVYVDTGYKVTVKVYYTDNDTVNVRYITIPTGNDNDKLYTFVMPENDVTVEVIFEVTSAEEFRLYLSEEEQDADGNTVDNAVTGIKGNGAVVTATYTDTTPATPVTTTVTVDKDSPRNNSRNLPAEMVHMGSEVKVDVQVHGDYEAVVRVINLATGGPIAPINDPTNHPGMFPSDATLDTDGTAILPTGGQITLLNGMPESDVVVYVTYRPAKKYEAILEVHHKDILPDPGNVAQLATTVYTKENEPQAGYSGVVYQDDKGTNTNVATDMADDNHRAVQTPFRVIDRVDVSSAAGSGSLGGDGRSPMEWDTSENSLMALLYTAALPTDFSGVAPLDLRWDTTPAAPGTTTYRQPSEGLRKNALGERYTDQDIDDFYDRLLEIQTLARAKAPTAGTSGSADPTVVTLVETTVTPSDGSPAYQYYYYDLTREQVQAYLLDYEAYQDYQKALTQYNRDKAKYDADYAQYLLDKAAYDAAVAAGDSTAVEPTKPIEPTVPAVVNPPALQTKTDAKTFVDGHSWYEPSATTTPPTRPADTATDGYRMEIRGKRQVAVVLEAQSTYTVASSIIIKDNTKDASGNPAPTHADIVLTNHSDAYQNEYLFNMPEYDCIVEVTYTQRKAQNLTLKIVGDYTPTVAGNNTTVTGYQTNPGSIMAAPITPLVADGNFALVLEDSEVSVLVHKDDGYSVSALVEYVDSAGNSHVVATNPSTVTNLSDGTLFKFQMPHGPATVTITYTDNKERLNAHLVFTREGSAGSGNNGHWQGTSLTSITALEGDHLVAEVNVEPGSYIYAVEAYTRHGAYPLTISGNGWNNGLGGQVTIDTDMPDEEYWVHVVFRTGPPAEEPGQILTLRVNDLDNTGASPVDNRAQVTAPTNLGPLGLVASPALVAAGSYSASQSAYVTAGETVHLNFSAGSTDFFVESIEIQPSGLGTSITRLTGTEAEFVMPAASATVVVTFRRRSATVTPENRYLHLNKTEQGDTPTPVNWFPSFTSPTIISGGNAFYTVPAGSPLPVAVPTGSGNNGAARPGETVEINLNVAPGWYIHSLTVSGDQGRLDYQIYKTYDRNDPTAAVPYDPYTAGNGHYSNSAVVTAVGTFVMPDSEAYVTVNYRKAMTDPPQKDENEYEVELVAEDPENLGPTIADNWASAVIDGDPSRTIAAVGKAKDALRRTASARAGEEVVIDYSADSGYALEIILVTPSGLHVPVNYFIDDMGDADATNDKVRARFTMPGSSVTAIVRFKKEPAVQYTANLVLHFPNGTAYNLYDTIGEGSFVTDTNGLTNKLYSMMAVPGTRLDFDMMAHDGYYIRAVNVSPEVLGVPAEYTGSFGYQSGHVIMPAANIQINVYFAEGWPDDTKDDPTTVNYDLTLEVYDASGSGSTANFVSIAGTGLTAPDSNPVGSGESRTIVDKAYDEDRVVVKLNPASGCYAKSITVTDSRGKDVPWQYVPGGIAFEMTPAHVTVTVKYDRLPEPDDPDHPYQTYEVMLHTGSTNGTTVTWGDDSSMGTAQLTGPNWPSDSTHRTSANGGTFQITTPPRGQTLTLVVTPEADHHVVAAYAVNRGTGAVLPLVTTAGDIVMAMPQVPADGTVTFAMPENNADVYVIFADSTNPDTPGPDPTRGDLPGTLTVVGPSDSGSAVMTGSIVLPGVITSVTTGQVSATGTGSLFAPQGTPLTVDLTVNQGYGIKAIRVTDGYGATLPYEWTEGKEGEQFTLTMAVTGGVRVYVELEKVTPRPTDPDDPGPEDSQLTAQVVVNNGGNAGNKAVLRYGPKNADGTIPAGTMRGTLLTPVYAGDRIWVDLTVMPGYQVEYVKVVPAKYGLDPTLYLPAIQSQDTSFLMPGEDVVVYVKFTRDTRTRRDVTLIAASDPNVTIPSTATGNRATVTTAYSGQSTVVHPPQGTPNTAVAQAAAATANIPAEWVTVDFGWEDGYSIASVVVVDASNNPVPFTQTVNDTANRKGQITFPMVDANVTVTVTWSTTLPKYEAVLHVIDLDNPAASPDSWGQLTWLNPPLAETSTQTSEVKALPSPGGTETLMVPAGETVQVDAKAEAGTYIQAAFVLWRSAGQMVRFDFDPNTSGVGFSGHKTDTFVMQPGRNDVYIYYTKVEPVITDYSAVVMLDSPSADTSSTATIERTRAGITTSSMSDTVTANDAAKTHGYVTAHDGDTITVTVTPANGFTIESVLMTPLGTSSDQGGSVVLNRVGNTYTFTMPAHNVAVRIKLREGNETEYKATLHYGMATINPDGSITTGPADTTKDWASASYTWGGSDTTWNTDGEWKMVPEGTDVTVGASITGTDYVFAAYVLRENGDMVPLSKALEGLTETDSPGNPLNLDDTTVFTMPASDVHIYVWFISDPPDTPWRTAVLSVFDSDPNDTSNNNSGLNSATLESSESNKTPAEVFSLGEPAHKFIWVAEGETVSIKTKTIADGYSFESASLSHSRAGVTQTLDPVTPTGPTPYTFTYEVKDYNSATVVRYVKSPMTRNRLNVVLIDKDNPGNGTVTNEVEVTPMSMTPLTVRSVTSAGARQVIPDVRSGNSVTFTITPDTGYTAVARLKDSSGTVTKVWPLGTTSDRFDMPNGETTLEITYFRGYTATLSVVYTGDTTASDYTAPVGQMVENAFGTTLTVTAGGSDSTSVPNGTKLTANLTTLGANDRLIGAILTTPDGSRWIAAVNSALPDLQKEFTHTINGKNAEIKLVVGPATDPDPYIASVSAVNLPTGTAAPRIHVTPTANATEGPGWTVAVPADTVTVTVDVPYGYKAVIASADVTLDGTSPIEIDGPANKGDSAVTGTATFTMPTNNVHVTVTYEKTRFTATIQMAGTGSGAATLAADGGTPANAPGTISNLLGTETLNYTATPGTNSTLTRILMATAGGVTKLLTYADGGSGTFTGSEAMLTDDVTITVFFDDDNNKHHIAYVTVVDPDNEPLNTARDIQNTTSALGGGALWAYGDKDHGMLVTFSVAPGYTAVVTAEYADGSNTPVSVTQQGSTGNATATLTMPDADVKVTITYSKTPPTDRKLKLRLVGHGQVLENQATLYAGGFGSSSSLALNGTMATSLSDLWSTNALTVQAGTALDLDAGRHVGLLGNYIIERATIGLLDTTGQALIPGTEVDIPLNEYGTTATGLHYMPDADAVVTVYYRLPYTATLFVVDANGSDYNDGSMPPGPADTTVTPHDRTPSVTMSVDRTDLTPNSTTKTHDPIKDLNGSETVTTQVDKEKVANSGTMPDDAEIASVIASTRSGTVHLTEDTTESTPELGVYKYSMADLPSRRADDVEITVVLRKKDDSMHTATVYKVGHDNKAGNTAAIANPTHPTLPSGTIWTGAYKDDEPVVTVTTEPGYYAIVTAVQTVAGTNVPVLQWTTQGTAADPIVTKFKMPDADVDVTVEYVKDPPKADMTLTLLHHDGEAENKGDLYKDAAAVPDPVATPSLTPFLSANGSEAVTPPVSPSTDPTITDPFSKTTTTPVDAGDYLALVADHGSGHYIKSITFQAAGFTFDMLNPPTGFVPRVPVSGGEIIIEFAPGKQSGRPFDPEHSERYYGTSIRLDPADNTKLGNYVTGDTTDGNPNPDLSVAPKEEQQGWILAESPDPEKNTVVVTVPTLYDEDTNLSPVDALTDAGVDPAPAGGLMEIPPVYQFYWWDEDNSVFVPFTEDDISILKGEPLSYANNPKGDYPRDADGTASVHHYGYRLTLQVVDGATSDQAKALKSYIENGGEIYVTATRPGTVPFTPPADNPTAADPQIPWVESEKTQIIIKQDNVLKPYDPDNVDDPDYEDHWIRAENRGDYLLVTVPMLNNKAGDNPTEVDGTKHRLQLHLQKDGTKRDSDIINVSDLLNIQNVRDYEHFWNVNLEYRSDDWRNATGYTPYLFEDIYENEIYYTDTSVMPNVDYHGARFAVEILTDDEIDADAAITDKTAAKANAAILRQIFDNDGTMGTNNYRMYITSDEVDALGDPLPTIRKDDYTDFEVPRYYSLAGDLESWAPTHIAELRLYRADGAGGYEPKPWLMLRSGLCETMSSTGDYPPSIYNGHWSMEFAFKSSELADDTGTVLTYRMVVKKPAHLTYTHTDIALDTSETTLYNGTTLVFSFARPISLFCGDIAPLLPGPNQKINDQDRDMLAGFNYGTYAWNEDDDQTTSTDWDNSTFNPYSYAYLADLNGDGVISERDMAILMSEFNWMRRTSDYGSPKGLGDPGTGIMLLMEDFLDGEAAGDEAAEGEQPSEDADTEERADPEEPSDSAGGSKEPENPDGTENPEDPDDTASEEPAAPEDSGGDEGRDTPEDPEEPVEPESPTEPVIPEDPIEPEDPTETESPDEPKDPDTPEVPEESTNPVPPEPETDPDQTPADPVTPSEPEAPETPEKPEDSDLTVSPGESAPETPGTENAEPKQPDAEGGGTQIPAQDEQSGGGETTNPAATTDPDQSAEKNSLTEDKL